MGKTWRWIGFRLAAAAVVMWATIGLLTMLFGSGPPLWSQEAAGWTQALGSVVAIFAAIWIANRDTRIRNDKALVVASLAAAEMREGLVRLVTDLSVIRRISNRSNPVDFAVGGNARINVIDPICRLHLFKVEDLARLSPIPGGCARDIAQAHSHLSECKEEFNKILSIQGGGWKNDEQRSPHHKKIKSCIEKAFELLTRASQNLAQFDR